MYDRVFKTSQSDDLCGDRDLCSRHFLPPMASTSSLHTVLCSSSQALWQSVRTTLHLPSPDPQPDWTRSGDPTHPCALRSPIWMLSECFCTWINIFPLATTYLVCLICNFKELPQATDMEGYFLLFSWGLLTLALYFHKWKLGKGWLNYLTRCNSPSVRQGVAWTKIRWISFAQKSRRSLIIILSTFFPVQDWKRSSPMSCWKGQHIFPWVKWTYI